jgi:protein ImuB
MRRILSIWLPQFPLERLQQQEPGAVPAEVPFALVTSQGSRLSIHAANAAAARAGIHPGMGLADARAVAPGLVSRPAEPARDRKALIRLARWCARYGPAFNTDGTDGLWVDTSGVAHLYGGEAQLLADLCRRLARFGLTARPGLADGFGAANALARFGTGDSLKARIAPAGASPTAGALKDLPVEALRLDAATVRLLMRLGLKRIGQLTELPRATLQRRFASRDAAEAVLLRLDQALGAREEPQKPLTTPPAQAARAVFTEPLIASEGLESALAGLIQDLCAGLEQAGRGARRLLLTLHRSDGTRVVLRAGLSRPSRSPAHLYSLLRPKLDGIDAGFGIDLILLEAYDSGRLAPGQAPLKGLAETLHPALAASDGAGEAIAALIDRLSGRLGAGAVLRLEPRASHLPERAEALVAALDRKPAAAAAAAAATPRAHLAPRPPLLLARPEPIEVVAEVPDGPPRRMRWRRSHARILRAEGPERIAPEWWHETGARTSRPRDYYLIEDDAGARFWVFREGLHGQGQEQGQGLPMSDADDPGKPPAWFLHGLFA